MKYNLDRAIHFVAEPQYKSLYQWALQEIGEEGKTGRDQIPWTLSHSFTATELTLNEANATQSEFETSRTWISAKLIPGRNRRYGSPSYSMFGTSRTIDQIQLYIHRIQHESDQSENSASAAGFPSYTSDDPLWGGTEPDFLQFDLRLSRDEFDRIANRIAANQVDAAYFSFHAHGFYSDWTPDIDADEFKVLCGERKEQVIELPDACDVDPPRLGEVWDATFSIQKVVQPRLIIEQLRREAAEEEKGADDHWDEPSLIPEPRDPRWVKPLFAELKMVKILVGAVVAILILGFLFR